MQLLTLPQAELEPFERQFKYRIYSVALSCLIMSGIALGSLVLGIRAWNEREWVGVFFCFWLLVWFGLFALLIFGMLRARMKSTNWLVRTQPGEMLIKFRSYLNHHFPDDSPIVVRIAYSEIEWARQHKVSRRTPGATRGDDGNRRYRYLEFRLREPAHTEELHKLLIAEVERKGPRTKAWFITGSRRSPHFPVQVVDGNIRVEWAVYPSMKMLLAEMGPIVKAETPASTIIDYRNLKDKPQREQETMLLQLIESGDRIGAVRAARHLYGYDLTRAVEFIKELSQNAPRT